MIRVSWDVEELVALIDLHQRVENSNVNVEDELKLLSDRLIRRADRLGVEHDDKFRNLNGMKMMYQNVQYIMSNGRYGLSASSTRMKKICALLTTNSDVFEMILEDFNQKY